MGALYQIVYASAATRPLPREELIALLDKARKRNSEKGVSGMLLFENGSFLQVLEGEEAAVETIYRTISEDPRHRDLLTLRRGPIEQRSFAEWSMAFVDARHAVQVLPGLSEFLRTGVSGLQQGDLVERILQGFRDGRYRRFVTSE